MIEILCAVNILLLSFIIYYRNLIPCFTERKFRTIGVTARTGVKETFCQVDIPTTDSQCQVESSTVTADRVKLILKQWTKECQTLIRLVNCHKETKKQRDDTKNKKTSSTMEFAYTCELCEKGKGMEAKIYCRSCLQYLCHVCQFIHKNCTATSRHSVVYLDKIDKLFENRPLKDKAPFQISKVRIKQCHDCSFQNLRQKSMFVGAGPFDLSKTDMIFLHLNFDCSHTKFRNGHIHFEATNSNTNATYCFLMDNTWQHGTECIFSRFCRELDGARIFITIPSKKSIYQYKVNSKGIGQYEKAFQTVGNCYGIAFFDKGLAVSVENCTGYKEIPKWYVQYVTFNGKVKQRVLFDKAGHSLFSEARHIASCFEQDKLYVSDCRRDRVTALDAPGNILFRFASPTMRLPRGLTTDREGNIYIACQYSVIQLERNGVRSRELLTIQDQKKQTTIMDVSFDNTSQRLDVIEDSSTGSVFEFL